MQFSEIFKIGAKLNIYFYLIGIKLTPAKYFVIELAHNLKKVRNYISLSNLKYFIMRYKSLILSLCLISFAVYAQAQKFELGIKAGVDIHKIEGRSFDEQFAYGYQVGAFAAVPLSDRFAIQPEVIFSQVNIDTSNDISSTYDFNNLDKVKLKYFKIPLLLNYSPNKFVSLQAGPQFGILLDDNSTLLENGESAFKKGDFSMIAGLQLNISSIKIYGRYGIGLNNINDIDNQEKWKNQNIQLGVGFKF